jgi:hypothetical protein
LARADIKTACRALSGAELSKPGNPGKNRNKSHGAIIHIVLCYD